MPAYDQVKVWEIDPSPRGSARTQRKEPARQPRIQPRRESRWSRPSIDSKPVAAMISFDWWTEEMGVWARLAVVGILASSILAWPYGNSCGFGLALYLIENGLVIKDGHTVGEDENERIKVSYTDSAFGNEGEVMRLDYEAVAKKKSWWGKG